MPDRSLGSVTREVYGEGKENVPNQPYRIGRQHRLPDRYSEGTENKPNQPPERSSEGKENVPNQPYRIGRGIGHHGGLAKERKTDQTNHTGSVARIGHQRGLRKRRGNKATIPDHTRSQFLSPDIFPKYPKLKK